MDPIKVIVTGLSRYSFEDSRTGKLVEGCNVHFLNLVAENSNDNVGYMPSKATLDYKAFEHYRNLDFPYVCDANMQVSFSGKKPSVKIIDFKPIKPFPLKLG